jgi:Alkylmercury lyase
MERPLAVARDHVDRTRRGDRSDRRARAGRRRLRDEAVLAKGGRRACSHRAATRPCVSPSRAPRCRADSSAPGPRATALPLGPAPVRGRDAAERRVNPHRADALGLDAADAFRVFAREDLVHVDAAGRPVVAYPFSATPRGHRVLVDGERWVEAMCAIDALGIAPMLGLPIEKQGAGRIERQPEFRQVCDDTIIGSARWTGADGRRQERFQVITFRDGKITDAQGCTSLRAAERFARRNSRSQT